jgi:hypothetical protein
MSDKHMRIWKQVVVALNLSCESEENHENPQSVAHSR